MKQFKLTHMLNSEAMDNSEQGMPNSGVDTWRGVSRETRE